MSDAKVLINFSSSVYTDLEVGNKSDDIIEMMTNNPNFQIPLPELDAVRVANTTYQTSLINLKNGTKEDTAIKNQNRRVLEKALKNLGLYVQIKSNGDEAIILSSGFDVAGKRVPVGKLPKPEGFGVKVGVAKGTVVVYCIAITYANFYEVEYAEVQADGTRNWIKLTSTKHKLEITGLASGKQYVFRMAGGGTNPARMWSDEIATYVI
jgi:hypothetical protein